jgi:RimJ/RimL family protein N-acetyltransferase
VDDLALMELKARALFTHGERGRIVASNEPEPVRAPRLFLGRTRAGAIWRVRDDLPADVVTDIARIVADEPPLAAPRRRPETLDALCRTLAAHAPVSDVWEGPAWQCPESILAPTDAILVGLKEREVLREHFPWTAAHLEAQQPCAAVLEDGVAVSICFSSRLTRDAAEAGLFTVEAFRGRGYAGKVVAAWARAVHASGRTPLYSTSWDNVASQAVARKLGLVLYGVELSLG